MDGTGRRFIPALAVLAVACAAFAAAWMTLRPFDDDRGRPERPLDVPVVRAPPIDVPNTAVIGGPPAPMNTGCANCGVVESVTMLQNHSLFQMHVRMGDGSVRTVEQPVPLVAGSRVVLRDGVARQLPVPSTQG